jgi:putative ABC transport system permease protein
MRPLLGRLWYLLRRRRAETDFEEELAFHREMKVREFEERGFARAEARRRAVVALGNTTLASDQVRDVWIPHPLQGISQDLRYAVRHLAKARFVSVTAIATLAIGIGAITAIFSTVNAVLLRPLPYARPNELLDVHTRMLDGRLTTGRLSTLEIGALANRHDLVARTALYVPEPFDATLMRPDGTAINAKIDGVGEGFFDLLGLPMTLGRAFTPDEHAPIHGGQAPISIVLSYRVWREQFAADPSIVGRQIRLAEAPTSVTVVGVANPAIDIPDGTDFWFNTRTRPGENAHNFNVLLRLQPGATVQQLEAAGAAAMANLAKVETSDVARAYVFRPLLASIVGDLRPTLLLVLGATALLLVLACVNVGNLLLARSASRMREIAVRSALGASRGRIVRQLLAESVVLAAAGGVIGLALASASVRLVLSLGASQMPRFQRVPFDARVLLFTLTILFATAVVIGLVPAWRLARADLRPLLNAGARTSSGGRATARLMSGMAVAQIALTIALVAGAGWLLKSFMRLQATDLGFAPAGRLVVEVRAPRRFSSDAEMRAWSTERLERVKAAAGDAVVGEAATFPFGTDRDGSLNVEVLGRPYDPSNQMTGGRVRIVSPDFFRAMGVKLVAGRLLTSEDRRDSPRVVVVNEAFVRRFLADVDPLTQSFAYGYPRADPKTMSRIVGVVADVRYKSPALAAEPTYYVPEEQSGPQLQAAIVVAPRDGRAESRVAAIRAELKRFDPAMIVTFTPAEQIVADAEVRQRLSMTLMVLFGVTALALAAVGIYGLLAYIASERVREIATRKTLGATEGDVLWMMLATGERLGIAGLAVGIASAYAGGRLVADSVFAMRAADPAVLAAAASIVGVVTAVAILIPAVHASRIDAVRALRAE